MLINKEGGVLLRLVLIKIGVVLFWGFVVCFVLFVVNVGGVVVVVVGRCVTLLSAEIQIF